MKTWLRLTLITITVGGGFTGVAITLQFLLNSEGQRGLNLSVAVVFLALYTYVTVCGLIFAQDAQQTRPLIAVLAIQIPWISSPLATYNFAAGFYAVVSVGSPGRAGARFGAGAYLGSRFGLSLFQANPWRIGVNLFALAMLILLLRAGRTPSPVLPLTASAANEAPTNSP